MRVFVSLLAVAFLLPLIPGASASEPGTDLFIDLIAGEEPRADGALNATLVHAVAGETYAWHVELTDEYAVAEVRVQAWFDIERPKQVVPKLDGRHFVEIFTFDPTEVDHPAPVLRLLGGAEDFTYRLGLAAPEGSVLPVTVNLTFTRDTTPPDFALGDVTDVTHFSFYLETTTTEPALSVLSVRRASGSEWILHPTPAPAILQRFPIQGLDAERDYEVRISFADWSGNEAVTPTFDVRTAPKPILPEPIITQLTPGPGIALPPGELTVISAMIESPESPISGGSIRFFLDLREITDDLVFEDGIFTYIPSEPLAPGTHRAALEVTNAAGGEAIARWSFSVAEPPRESGGGLLLIGLLGLTLAACGLRRH